jgi:hypothetical protein
MWLNDMSNSGLLTYFQTPGLGILNVYPVNGLLYVSSLTNRFNARSLTSFSVAHPHTKQKQSIHITRFIIRYLMRKNDSFRLNRPIASHLNQKNQVMSNKRKPGKTDQKQCFLQISIDKTDSMDYIRLLGFGCKAAVLVFWGRIFCPIKIWIEVVKIKLHPKNRKINLDPWISSCKEGLS